MLIFTFLGPPGAGKGTMAEKLCQRHKFYHLSTGKVFRDEIASGSEMGNQVKDLVEGGHYVPDELVSEMVLNYIHSHTKAKCIVLDGFPRTMFQANFLAEALPEMNLDLAAAVNFDVAEDVIKDRLTGRRMCAGCGRTFHLLYSRPRKAGICDVCSSDLLQRADDSEETVIERLTVYKNATVALLDYYEAQGKLLTVDATGDPKTTFARLLEIIQLDG